MFLIEDFDFLFFSFKKGEVKNGLLVDPRDEMAYYPLGSSIVAFPLRGGQKSFLTGHTYLIGTIAISNSGKYLASGETDNVGTKVKNMRIIISISFFLKIPICNF